VTREETKAAADASWGVDLCPVCGRTIRNHPGCTPCTPEPRQTRLILVTLKKPVKLPVCLLDAIRLGGIEKISALDEAITCTEIGSV
jgi:hypothetical protein